MKSKRWQGHTTSGGHTGRRLLCLFQLLEAPGILSLAAASLYLLLPARLAVEFPSLSLLRTLVIELRTHLDNPDKPFLSKSLT